jgi:hypothetical protein
MGTWKHKILRTLLGFLLVVATFQITNIVAPEDAEAATEYQDYTVYGPHLDELGLEDAEGDIVIPETLTYKGVKYRVTEIGNYAFAGNTKITSVTIPSTVTKIGQYAFRNCSSLKSVVIPSSVTKISDYAFMCCSSLKSVKMSKLDSIGTGAFENCTSLEKITVNAKKIGDSAFYGCSSLEKAVFGDNVKTIGIDAFALTALKSIDFGKNITKIGYNAVRGCPYLEKITVGEKVTTLGGGIDSDCGNIKTITVKSDKLKAKNCQSAFTSGYDTLTIKVPAEKLKKYKKFLWYGGGYGSGDGDVEFESL